MKWTDAELDVIRKHRQTHTASQIAAMLGRTKCSVNNKASTEGIVMAKYGENHYESKAPTPVVKVAIHLCGLGYTQKAVAERLRIGVTTVRNWVNNRTRTME